MILPICSTSYHILGEAPKRCELAFSEECPLMQRKWEDLGKEPCCYAICIPCKYLTEAKQDRRKAAKKYVEDICSSE